MHINHFFFNNKVIDLGKIVNRIISDRNVLHCRWTVNCVPVEWRNSAYGQ